MNTRRIAVPFPLLLATLSICAAVVEIARMFRYLLRSVTNVFWVDQWIMLEELWRFRDGRYRLTYLWTPYWGHRIPIPRLVFLLDERWFHLSNVPLVALNVAAQACLLLIISVTQWKLLSPRSRPLALSTIALTSYLLFSGLQMENFVYGMSVQYAIGYCSAIAALTFGAHSGRRSFLTAVTCAVLSTLTIAAGLALWPLLAVETYLLRGIGSRRSRTIVLAAAGALLSIAYIPGYTQPGSGMGLGGIIHHPLQAAAIASMFLAGPLSLASLLWGHIAGAIGMLLALYLLTTILADRRPQLIVLAVISVWLVGISFSIPLARMRPEWIASFHGAAPLPSRYFTPAFLFWSCLTAALLSVGAGALLTRALTAICLLAMAAVLVSTLTREQAYLLDWLSFTQRLDAAGAGFLIGADDPEYMSASYPDQKLLDHWIPYARAHRLSVFAEPRAQWLNRKFPEVIRAVQSPPCRLRLDPPVQAGAALRLTGWLENAPGPLDSPDDLLFTDEAGTVIGFGRTFAPAPNSTDQRNFLGYVSGKLSAIYILSPEKTARRCITQNPSG